MVAAAVEPLVVGRGVVRERREGGHADAGSRPCSAGAGGPAANSSSVSLPGLSRMRFETPELADVVQQPRAAQVAQAVRAVSRARSPTRDGVVGHAARSGERVRRLGVDDLREGLGDAVEPVLVGQRDDVVAARASRSAALASSREPPPQPVVVAARASSASASAGSNQRPRRSRTISRAASTAEVVEEDLDGLREARDARQRAGSASPASPSRLALAVPVLVEGAHGLGRRRGELQHRARCCGAALAAGLDQIASASRPAAPPRAEPAAARAERRAGGRRAVQAKRGASAGLLPVDELDWRLSGGRRRRTAEHMRAALLEQPASLSRSA